MNPSDPTWFYWPVTFAVAATVAALNVSKAAECQGRSPGGRLVLAAFAASAVTAPVVALGFGIYADCNDSGHIINFRPLALAVGAVVIVAWLGFISFLLRSVGQDFADSQRLPTRIFLFMLPAMLVEFLVSTIAMEGYCNDYPGWMYGQLLAAAAFSLLAGAWVMVKRELSSESSTFP